MSQQREFDSLGVPAPRRTFLDGRSGRPQTQGGNRATTGAGAGAGAAAAPHPPSDTKTVILAEHKTELLDMLQESVSLLKNVYRSKFVFGGTLKHVDPSFGGDNVGQFNLTTPPSFDPAYGGGREGDDEEDDEDVPRGVAPVPGATDPSLKEKLRTAEELIKKVYRRNTQLETDNKHLKAEVARMERLQGLSRTKHHSLNITDGHIPLDHPIYTKKMRRNCRSVPPQRTLMRAAVDGFGLTFPPRPGSRDDQPVPREDPLPVAQLKRRVLQLTEALVSLQHDNEQLVKERTDRQSLREKLMKQYLMDRDTHIAQLHTLLQDLITKVNNPMKLMRAKQPSLNINPVVATNNVLREVSQKLAEQIAAVTGDIVRKTSSGLPPAAPIANPNLNASAGPESPMRQQQQTMMDPGTLNSLEEVDKAAGTEIGARRKELARRLKQIVETLPVGKRKQLLLLMGELKELYTALVHSNQSLLSAYEDSKVRMNGDLVRLKMQVAVLRDQLRSLGVSDDAVEGVGKSMSSRAQHDSKVVDP